MLYGQPFSIRLLLPCLFSLIIQGLYGQNEIADKKIIEIESYKRYKIQKVDNKDDLKPLGDSTSEVTGLTNYLRKGDGRGKVTESSKFKGGETNRTYYFNEKWRLFAMVDFINYDDKKTSRLTYYFGNGQLLQVVDENKNIVTDRINKEKLYNWIRMMFTDQTIEK